MGVKYFGHNWDAISRLFVLTKTPDQLAIRHKNLVATRAPPNSIKVKPSRAVQRLRDAVPAHASLGGGLSLDGCYTGVLAADNVAAESGGAPAAEHGALDATRRCLDDVRFAHARSKAITTELPTT